MRISLNWVEQLLAVDSLPLSDEQLFERLISHVAEIEEIEIVGPNWDHLVVGKVLSVSPHPNADKLRCCQVDVGQEQPSSIVCGAANVAAEQYVCVALPGAVVSVPGRDGAMQEITIKKGKLRGEPSHGMICAEDELGLGDSHDGIMVLDPDHHAGLKPGIPLSDIFNQHDRVLIIDNHNINHRPDLWGQLGWAREIAAICQLPAPAEPDLTWGQLGKLGEINEKDETGNGQAPLKEDSKGWGVTIANPDRCRSYKGLVIQGVTTDPRLNGCSNGSPRWPAPYQPIRGCHQCGQRWNWSTHACLRPTSISGQHITVRQARDGEAMTH